MSSETRSRFQADIHDLRQGVALLAASVTELVPRVTMVLLDQDLEGAE
jgi:hypothetical protein